MIDFLFFGVSPALMTVAAILLRKRMAWQIPTTILLGLALLLIINFEGLWVPAGEWKEIMGGLLLDGGPILGVTLFLLAIQRGAQRVVVLLLGVPASYFVGFAVGVQSGLLLGLVKP
jgi:hypothetical protein